MLIKFLNFLSNTSACSNSSSNLLYLCNHHIQILLVLILLIFFFTVLNSSRASFLFLTHSLFMLSIIVPRINNSNESLSPLYLEKTSEAIFLYNCKSFIHDKSSPLSSFPLSLGLGGLAGIITLPAKPSLISFSNFTIPSS